MDHLIPPPDPSALISVQYTQALIFKSQGETVQALAKFREILYLSAEDSETRLEAVQLLLELGEREAAMKELVIAIFNAMDPEVSEKAQKLWKENVSHVIGI
ncbi:hypothetical protein CCAX7_45320 [Capsulimonas corticalis]|uniref:Uncharacterized protein n=1 Tax=Capsulimonas corticalis TaxID=2219043 RepID=A0A402D6F3_9BACT|nr:tetratricopeptide repeat protein [Capsulimonas corticalis]BDI32481.1 hypothetical protein CCAX7_45320 [Capsulimonas corticalis]